MTLPDFLTSDPYGYIHVTGHRIGLRHIIELYREQYSPEMIVNHYPTLPLAMIHKIIAFYLENQKEVDAYVKKSQEAVDRMGGAPQIGPDAAELHRRMEALQKRESA